MKMKMRNLLSFVLTLIMILSSLTIMPAVNVSAANPYLPLWEHLPDGEPSVFEDPDNPGKYRAYIIGSHDLRYTSYCGPDIRVWSAPVEDLTDWRDDGPVFTFQDPQTQLWDVMYAPDMVEVLRRDENGDRTIKEYYLYPHSRGPGREAMVAKGSRPDGPFEPINLAENGRTLLPGSVIGFDPAVFIDYIDDPEDPDYDIGFRAYAYWGWEIAVACELDQETMWSPRPGTEPIRYFIPTSRSYGNIRDPQEVQDAGYPYLHPDANRLEFNYFEAFEIRKVGNKYILTFSGYSGPDYGLGSTNSALRWAYGDSPLGPWMQGGVLVDSRGPVPNENGTGLTTSTWGHNTHGSLEKINDQWYVFYHRPPRSFGYMRQAVVAPVKIDWDEASVMDGGKVSIRAYDPYAEDETWTAKGGAYEYTGAEITSEGFHMYGLDPYKYYSAGIVSYLSGGSASSRLQDSWDIWDNHMPLNNVQNGERFGWKYFGFGGLDADTASKIGLHAFEGTKAGDNTKFNVWITPKTDQAFSINVMLDGPYSNQTWNGKNIGVINVPAGSAQQVTQFTIDVGEHVESLNGKNAIYLLPSGQSGTALCDIIGLGFSKDGKDIERPISPSVSIQVDDNEIALPATPVRSTDQNGIVDYSLYHTSYETPFRQTDIPFVTASASNENVNINIKQAEEIGGTAVVEFEYNDVVKTYTVDIQEAKPPTITGIKVDGVSLNSFNPDRKEYTYYPLHGFTEIPVVTADWDDDELEVTIVQADSIPGVATITASTDITSVVYTINFPDSAALVNHTMETREDFDAAVGGYVVRHPDYQDRKNATYDTNNNAMRFESTGLWNSAGFRYDISSLMAAYSVGTEFILSMDVRPQASDVTIGFSYDWSMDLGQGTTFRNLPTNAFTTLTLPVTLRQYNNRVDFFAFNGDPVITVRNILLTVAEDEPAPTLDSIAITSQPTKQSYFIGEPLDLTGLVVTGTYSDSSSKQESVTMANISGFNSSAINPSLPITVTVEGKTATFNVEIKGLDTYHGTSKDNGDGTFDNDALLDSDTPDPRIIQHNGAFYMISTSMAFSPGLPVMKSYDLVNWEVVNYVYNILADYDELAMRDGKYDYGRGSWAPSLAYNPHDKHFYASHTSNTSGKTYFYKTDDIENGTWTQTINDTFFHDGGMLFDDDGTPYMFYGSGAIYVQQLTPDMSGIVGPRSTIITAAMTTEIAGDNNSFLEATHAYKVGDTYYVFMCGWPGGRTKLQFVFKSKTVDSGYEGKLIIDDGMGRGEGASQGGLIPMPDGSFMGYFMHRRGAAGRGLVLTQCIFDEEGWPIVTEDNSLKISRTMDKPIQGDFERKSIVNSWDFSNSDTRPAFTYQTIYDDAEGDIPGAYTYNGSNLMPGFEWNHNPDNRYWSLTERLGYLRLTNGYLATNNVVTGAKNVLTTRTFGPESIGSIAMDISEMKNGDVAGLAAFNRLYAYAGVKMVDGEKYIIYRNRIGDDNPSSFSNNDPWAEVVIAPIDPSVNRVYFKVQNDYKTYGNERAYFYYSLDGENWINTNQSRKVDFGYPQHFNGFRFAIFNFATEETGGFVDFDYFSLGDHDPQGPNDTPREMLEYLIGRANKRVESDYTPESWEPFAATLSAAILVLNNAGATDEQFNTAYDALLADMNALELNSLTNLANLIEEAKATDKTDWSDKDLAAIADAIATAQNLIDIGSTNDALILAATEALQKAIQAQPVPRYGYAAYGTPELDNNVIDPLWDNARELPINRHLTMPDGSTNGVGKILWDDENLYVMTTVTDPLLNSGNSNEYQHDSVEAFVDEGNTKSSSYVDGMGQYRVSYNNLQSFGGSTDTTGFDSWAWTTEDGYIVLMKIPFKTKTPTNGMEIGLDLQINDAGSSDSRQDVIMWYDWSGNNWQSGTGWGTAMLTNKTALQELYDANKDKDRTAYTTESWTVFENTLTMVANVLSNTVVTQAEIDAAEASLNAAIRGLLQFEVLLNHTMATQEDYDAVVDGYVNRVTGQDAARSPSYSTTDQAMIYLTNGLWTSSGFKYDITSLISEYPIGTEFKLSMDVKPTAANTYIGFLYDYSTDVNSGEMFTISTSEFTTISTSVTLRSYNSRVYFYAFCGQPSISVKNIVLGVAEEPKEPNLDIGFTSDGAPVDGIVPGETLNIEASLEVFDDTPLKMYAAIYDKDGTLIKVVDNVGTISDGTANFNLSLEVPSEVESGAFAKVFFWTTESSTPMIKSIIF